MKNRICTLFQIEKPIIQAGMIWCSGWELAAAVSEAGGLGLIGAGSMYPDILREQIRKCKQATSKPFGVNIPLLYPDIDAHDNWEQKAEILRGYGITVHVSNLIKNNALKFAEQNAIEYNELVKLKYDLRDILQHKKLSGILKPEAITPPSTVQSLVEVKPFEQPEPVYYSVKREQQQHECWIQEIAELEN
ncbi:MAG: hypothetical protein EBU33_07820, partial [Sphingobacteriia bacterium]|nr:hypothetical protein [Sphingobacteriia bacterium]